MNKTIQGEGRAYVIDTVAGLSTSLWRAGCWDDQALLDYNKTLIEATAITPLMQRKLKY